MSIVRLVRWPLLLLAVAAAIIWLAGAGIFRVRPVNAPPTPVAIRPTDSATASILARGDAAFETGDYSAAITAYSDALTLAPDTAETYNNRGLAYYRLSDTDRAVADFNHALALRPDYVNALTNRAIALFDKGDYEAVIADTSRAIALDPEADSAYMFRGNAYQRVGDWRGAFTNWARANAIRAQRQVGGY
jgi:tetratricopeptide (TPR) repeat protein